MFILMEILPLRRFQGYREVDLYYLELYYLIQYIDGIEVTAPGRPPMVNFRGSLESGIDVLTQMAAEQEEKIVTVHTSRLFFICFGVNDKVRDRQTGAK